MKLYATVTSERASKGQGGNEYLEVVVTMPDSTVMMFLKVYPDWTYTLDKAREVRERGRAFGANNIKGEKQKGEVPCAKCGQLTIPYCTLHLHYE